MESLLATEWLYLAVEAGDPEAMYEQAKSHNRENEKEAWAYWLEHAAEAGWPAAMEEKARYVTSEEELELWLRKAAMSGASGATLTLADLVA
ncbi:hypothetical protein ACFQ7Z_10740 [Streptomyces virginiae]|uniref:hypothetical protein n=1 Tax=Streptomyces virginiae TaxID=1961 RepID=UPI0036968BAE